MIASYNGLGCISPMKLPDLLHKLLPFFADCRFAFRIFEIRRIGWIYTSYIFCKELILYLKPFFLLSKLVEPCCNFLNCQYFTVRCFCHCLLFY